jgi:Tfp pilus assembly protein PilF
MNAPLRLLMLTISQVIALSFASGAAVAADTGSTAVPAKPADPTLERARDAITQKNWSGAQAILRDAVARDTNNADYHNLYAYSTRKGPNPDMSLVFKEYNEALSIDPKHRGAHEYIGEAYLMVGNVAKAKEHLAQLDKICFFACSEFSDLKNAIAAFETKTAVAK